MTARARRAVVQVLIVKVGVALHRVVVTGLGAVTPVGLNLEDTWSNLLAGVSGISRITVFDPSENVTKIAGQVDGFDPTTIEQLERREISHMDRVSLIATAASMEAAKQAQYSPEQFEDKYRVAAMIGCGIGGTNTNNEFVEKTSAGPFASVARRSSPFTMPMVSLDTVSSNVATILKAHGPSIGMASACASGADAISQSARMIRWGELDMVLTGGAESGINRYSIAAFNACRALSTRNDEPERASRPFDKQRDGFILAEGAGALVLESLESAQRRGVQPIAELAGFGNTSDAYHMTRPHPEGDGATEAMRQSLAMADMQPGDVSYINAHGTSTPINDLVETKSIKRIFGKQAYNVPISSTKSMTGHMAGAAGGVEAVVSVLAISRSAIPPTINLEEPDPECDLDYVPNLMRRGKVDSSMSNSFGFGGHNACLLFKRFS